MLNIASLLSLFLLGAFAGSFLTMLPKAHKEAEKRYFDELENDSPVYEGLEKYRVKHD